MVKHISLFLLLFCFACGSTSTTPNNSGDNSSAGGGGGNGGNSSGGSATSSKTTDINSKTFGTATVVSSEGSLGTSLVLDSSDKGHMAFYIRSFDSQLKIATEGSSSWSTAAVDNASVPLSLGGGAGPAMVKDSSNKLHIVYYDGTNTKYATNKSGSFVTSTVTGASNAFSSIAIDSDGILYVAYSNSSAEDLIYATSSDGSTWSLTTVDNGDKVGFYNSIAIDNQKKVHIAYWDRGNNIVKYATNSSGIFATQTIDTGAGAGLSLKVDGSDKIHIVYFAGSSGLKYATNSSGSWVTATAYSASGEVGQEPALALDGNGKSHVCHHDHPNDDLRYASNISGSWQSRILESGSNSSSVVGRNCSITLTSDKKVVICYDDGSQLKCIKES